MRRGEAGGGGRERGVTQTCPGGVTLLDRFRSRGRPTTQGRCRVEARPVHDGGGTSAGVLRERRLRGVTNQAPIVYLARVELSQNSIRGGEWRTRLDPQGLLAPTLIRE